MSLLIWDENHILSRDFVTINVTPSLAPDEVADGNGNGIHDDWEEYYFLGADHPIWSESTADADPDRDGCTNLQEYLSGTNPWVKDVEEFEEPKAFPADGYVSYLKPEDLAVGSRVTEWPDSDEDGLHDAVQWDAKYEKPLVEDNVLNGLAGVRMMDLGSGVPELHIPDALDWSGGPEDGDFEVIAVYKPDFFPSAGHRALFGGSTFRTGINFNGTLRFWNSNGLDLIAGAAPMQADTLGVIGFSYGGASGHSSIHLNGQQVATGSGPITDGVNNSLYFNGIGGMRMNPGVFGDVIVFDRKLDNEERCAIHEKLMKKYGLLEEGWWEESMISYLKPEDLAVGSRVTEWPDSDEDGLHDAVQWDAKYEKPLVEDNVLNGLAGVRMMDLRSGVPELHIPDALDWSGGPEDGDFEVIAVYKPDFFPSAGHRALFGGSTFRTGINFNGTLRFWNSSGLNLIAGAPMQADTLGVIGFSYGGASGDSSIHLNGQQVATGSGPITDGVNNSLYFNGIGGMRMNPGIFGDVIVFDRKLTYGQRLAVQKYLMEKYGITPTP